MAIKLAPNCPKTITMSQEQKDTWLSALRSGDYKQTTETLFRESTGGYCCLGVLQKVLSGDVTRYINGTPDWVPSREWLREHGIQFFESNNELGSNPTVTILDVHGEEEPSCVAGLNDEGHSFAEIADVLEQIIEVR